MFDLITNNLPMIVDYIVTGKGTDFIFNVVLAKTFLAIEKNFLLLWMLAQVGKKIAAVTSNKFDDKFFVWLISFLTRFRPTNKGNKNGPNT